MRSLLDINTEMAALVELRQQLKALRFIKN
jgi:hypothetical protein